MDLLPLRHAVMFCRALPTEILNTTRRAARWDGVSIVWLALTFKNCLSPRVAIDRSQEINKLFVPETTASVCVLYLHLNMYRCY